MTTREDKTKRVVEAGVALLDYRYPGWFNDIDLAILDLSSGCNCVLGQLAMDYADTAEDTAAVAVKVGAPATVAEQVLDSGTQNGYTFLAALIWPNFDGKNYRSSTDEQAILSRKHGFLDEFCCDPANEAAGASGFHWDDDDHSSDCDGVRTTYLSLNMAWQSAITARRLSASLAW